jgi:3-oxoacyl-[acyl-carrier protein] reductase
MARADGFSLALDHKAYSEGKKQIHRAGRRGRTSESGGGGKPRFAPGLGRAALTIFPHLACDTCTRMNLTLNSKVALITGGSRGIGAAAVRLFVGAGAKVAFNYQAAKAQADDLVEECGPANCRAFESDLSTTDAAQQLVASAIACFGGLDILVANHGIWPPEDVPIDRMSDQQWQRTMAVNLDSVFALVKHSVGQMKKQGGGNIVLVGSTAGQRGEAFHCDYAASKGALISMVKGLSTELARDLIYVNCVAPGWVDTDMSASSLKDPATRAKIFGGIPLGRVGTPEEIAAPILFLCTPYAGFITGEVFNVNGGAVLIG